MPTPIGTNVDVDLNDIKLVASSAQPAGIDEADLKWRLAQALQTSLEIESVINTFSEQVQPAVAFDGFSFTLEALDIDLKFGKQAVHACSYRLVTQQDYLGELTFYRNKRFPERDLVVLESLLNSLVFPLRNAIQYRDAITKAMADPLTGAGNRIALNNTLQREIALAKRYDQSMALLMMDLDHFKQINDTFGHSCGDQVLKTFVATMKREIRDTDVIFRYGGEEFVVLLISTDLTSSEIIAERLRESVINMNINHEDQKVETSVSIGLSFLRPGDTETQLIDRADAAMYRAKKCGRNQVKICQSDIKSVL